MKIYFMAALCIITLVTACHTTKPTAGTTPVADKLLGVHPASSLEKPPYSEWYRKEYDGYQPDSSIINALRPLLRRQQVTVFLGTWCGDSRREVPRLLHVLKAAGLPDKQLKLVMVDNAPEAYKQSPGREEAGLNIFRVPTVTITEKGAEKGRIVESPVESLEKDLLHILQGDGYQPRYPAGQAFLQQLNINPNVTAEQLTAGMKPVSRSELNGIGYMLLADKKPQAAMLAFRANTLLYPDDPVVFSNMADASLALKDSAVARESLRRALQLDPKNEAALKLQGRLVK